MPNTQPPPAPTFTEDVSFLDKTVTFEITDITNANDKYSLQIERGDGTVLKTKELKVGETSFTWSHEESSFGTYNYVIKLIYEKK